MIFPWKPDDFPMKTRWFSHENQMIFPWKPDDFPIKTRWFSHENQMIFPWKSDDFPMKTFIYNLVASNRNTSGIQKSCSIARRKRQFLTPEVSRAGSPRWFGPGFGTRKILRKSNIPAWENQVSLNFTDVHRFSLIFGWFLADFFPIKSGQLMCP